MVSAQFTLSGIVRDADSGKPVPFTTVALLKDTTLVDGTISSGEGVFAIENIAEGMYKLLIRSIGYKEFVQDSIVITGNLNLSDLRLKEAVNTLADVVVSGQRSSIETHLGKKVLNIGNDLSASGASVTEALDRLPSVSTDLNGGINIRGSSNVIIYVNGKETRRDSKTLQYMSAGALEKIEVITNPSAKYDAEGVGGIINLVFKKNSESDLKLEAFAGITTPYRFRTGLNGQVSSQKLTAYLAGSVSRSEYITRLEKTRQNEEGDLQLYENLISNEANGRITNITAGLTYELDSSFSLNFEYTYLRWLDNGQRFQNNNFFYSSLPDLSLNLRNKSRELEDEMNLSFSLDKEWGKDRSLKVLFNGGGEIEDNESLYNLDNVELNGSPLSQTITESKETEEQELYQLTIDYESPLKGFGAVETGLKMDNIRFEISQTLDFLNDELFLPQNQFTIRLKKYAAYVIHKREWEKFEYGLGVRLEHFNSQAHQETTGERNEQNVTRLFPSVQLVYRPFVNHQMAFNYSRRINRPGFFDLNPFVSFTDPLILETGNPDLQPEFAHNFELSYQYTGNTLGLDISLFQRTTTNIIQQTVEAFDADRLLFSYTNFGKRVNEGAELSANSEVLNWLELTGNFSWYHTRFEAEAGDLDVRFNRQSTWQASLQQRINLKDDLSIELSQSYRSPRIGIQSRDEDYYYVGMAVRKSFKNKRAIVTLNFQDIFDTRIFKTTLRGEDFVVRDLFKFQTRRLSLELRYKIFD